MQFKLILSLFFGSFFCAATLSAQSKPFIPLNIQEAFKKGTRSMDGKPGHDYWQNKVKYTIEANLDVATRILTGSETIVLDNNSPDSLQSIRIKLQHDLYKKGAQRNWAMDEKLLNEGTKVSNITLNGRLLSAEEWSVANTFLILNVKEMPILPKTSCEIALDWIIELPGEKGAPRECFCDSTTFFVPYWYPQIAVYDDIDGWATWPYSGLTEFYHEFADYDVKITVPENTMVWATGVLATPEQHFSQKILENYQRSKTSNNVVQIWTAKDQQAGTVFKKIKGGKRTYQYQATNVPDFAFAGSDHYNWDATSIVVDAKNNRRTHVHAAYNPASEDYYQVARIAAEGLNMMSTWLPGYPYPYPALTVFNGDDGMEYPMILNDASTHPRSPMTLTVHESAHNYFPFMMGINEQKYAWMDEGWAAFLDYLVSDSLSHGTEGRQRGYEQNAGKEVDVPPMVLSYNMSYGSYRNASYARPQVAYLGLLDLLGYETFHACMTEYMDTWKGKHPLPYDFFNTFNRVSGQDLDWYWKPWFFDWGYPDLAITGVEKEGDNQVILVENKGSMPVPVYANVVYTDGTSEVLYKKSDVWKTGNTKLRVSTAQGKIVKTVVLEGKAAPDVNVVDNKY